MDVSKLDRDELAETYRQVFGNEQGRFVLQHLETIFVKQSRFAAIQEQNAMKLAFKDGQADVPQESFAIGRHAPKVRVFVARHDHIRRSQTRAPVVRERDSHDLIRRRSVVDRASVP